MILKPSFQTKFYRPISRAAWVGRLFPPSRDSGNVRPLLLWRLVNPFYVLLACCAAAGGCSQDRPPQRTERAILQDPDSYIVWSVAFSPDGERLAMAGSSGLIKLWDVGTGTEVATLGGHKGTVQCVAYSPDGTMLASGGGRGDGSVRLWHLKDPTRNRMLPIDETFIHSVGFSPDGKTLAIGGEDTPARLWDLVEEKERPILQGNADARKRSFVDRDLGVAIFSPCGDHLAMAVGDRVTLWDTATLQSRTVVVERNTIFQSLAFTPDGKSLIAGGMGSVFICWDLASLKEQWRARPHDGSQMYSIAVHPDGKYVVTSSYWQASSTALVQIWDTADGKELARFDAHMHDVSAMAFSRDGKILATGGGGPGGATRLWDFAQVKP